MSDVRINIDFANGTLDIEGDSEFVDKQVARFENEIKQQLSNKFSSAKKSSNTQNPTLASSNGGPNEEPTVADSSYDDVFEIHDDKTHIVKDIPGGSLKEKIICVSLLLSLGESLRGNDTTLIEDIRAECLRHGCMDNKNFSTYVKSYNTLMIDSGSGRSATLKLTMPGSKKAKDLVDRIRQGDLGDFFSTIKPKMKAKTKAKAKSSSPKAEKDTEGNSTPATRGRPRPGEILKKLVEDGFFSTPKSSEEIIEHCKDNLAYTYEMSEISSSLTRATRNNLLTRSKDENGQYEYASA